MGSDSGCDAGLLSALLVLMVITASTLLQLDTGDLCNMRLLALHCHHNDNSSKIRVSTPQLLLQVFFQVHLLHILQNLLQRHMDVEI